MTLSLLIGLAMFGTVLALFINFGRSLGHSGAVPPVPAAWAGNLFYGLAFAGLFARARR